MAIEWIIAEDRDGAFARTIFARLMVFPDPNGVAGYEARVRTIDGAGLASRGDFSTIPEAQAWCGEEYAKWLATELAQFSSARTNPNPPARPPQLCSFCGNQTGEPFVVKAYPSTGESSVYCTRCFVRQHGALLV